ncbi:MAG: hypothetical protein ACHP78_02410 [Terriglobales bacterium]
MKTRGSTTLAATLVSRRALTAYIWCLAAYEIAIIGWFRSGGGNFLLDPRFAVEWMFASTLASGNPPFLFSVASAIWLVGIGFGIGANPKLLWVYGIVESCLGIPTLLLIGTVLFLGSGHIGIGATDLLLAMVVFALFSLIPIVLAFRIAAHSP